MASEHGRRRDTGQVIAVGGCMMKVPENVERIKKSYPYVDLVFDPQQLHRFPVLMRFDGDYLAGGTY